MNQAPRGPRKPKEVFVPRPIFKVSVRMTGSRKVIHLGEFDTPEAANKALEDFQKSA